MKHLILTDTHLGVHGSSDIWHEVVLNLFREVVEVCKVREIDSLIHLGDFFDNRKSTNTKTIDYAMKIGNLLNESKLQYIKILVGNHDCYYRNTIEPTALSMLNKYEKIEIVNKNIIYGDIYLLPWGSEPITETKYCMGHLEIRGFNINDSYISRFGLLPEVFNSYDLVLSGHFHNRSKQGNIFYIGSPYQQNFGEVNHKKYYYIFEEDNGNLEEIEFTSYPKYLYIYSSEIKDVDYDSIKGNIVKIIFNNNELSSKQQNEFIKNIYAKRPLQLSIDHSLEKAKHEIKEELDIPSDNKDIIRKYISKIDLPKDINKKTLNVILQKMLEKVDKLER